MLHGITSLHQACLGAITSFILIWTSDNSHSTFFLSKQEINYSGTDAHKHGKKQGVCSEMVTTFNIACFEVRLETPPENDEPEIYSHTSED